MFSKIFTLVSFIKLVVIDCAINYGGHFPNVVNKELYGDLVEPGEIKNCVRGSCHVLILLISFKGPFETTTQSKKDAFRVQKNNIYL